jgi:tetratricopeptide (TPR) repeat protein
MSASYQRAWVLYFELKRYDLAERELRGVLVDRPEEALAHALLSLCLTQRQHYQDAAAEAKEALRLAPNLAFAHYVRARLLGARNQLSAARAEINEAIRLDPVQADYFSWLAAFLYDSGHWRDALSVAEKGLELDPLHVSCTNLRALSLAKLGRREEAKATSRAALARDPVNAISHAIQATTLMRQVEYGQARAHFLEALRLDPLCEWAHRGRFFARWGYLLTFVPRMIGRWVRALLHSVMPSLGEPSDKSAAFVGGIVLVAANAGAISLVDRTGEVSSISLGLGLAALLLAWLASRFRGLIAGLLWALSIVSVVPWFLGIVVAAEVARWPTPRAWLWNQVAWALSGAAMVSLFAFLLGTLQAGILADLSLPRRKPERPASGKR